MNEPVDLSPEDSDEVADLELEFPVADEPEEISSEDIKENEIVVSEDDLESAGHIAELVCECCLELNLTSKSLIKCSRCDQAFCIHHASTIDVQYCTNCMKDVVVTKEVISKVYGSTKTTYYRRKARQIKIDGLDWLFAQRKIQDQEDIELDLSIEYHRNILGLLLAEQERRRTEKMHRYAKVTFKTPSAAPRVNESTTTTVKKTRTTNANKNSDKLQAIMKAMLAKGFTKEQLEAMLKK